LAYVPFYFSKSPGDGDKMKQFKVRDPQGESVLFKKMITGCVALILFNFL